MDRTPFLLASALVLGLVAQVALPAGAPSTVDVVQRRSGKLAPHPLPMLPIPADVAGLGSRSPFAASDAAGASAGADAAPEGAFTLLGFGSDRSGASVVLKTAGGATYSARQGDTVLGWRVAVARAGGALLTREGRTQVLTLGAAPARTAGAAQ